MDAAVTSQNGNEQEMSETESAVAKGPGPLAGSASTPPNASLGAETGTVTILFTDLEGSTDLRLRVGDTVANEVIRAHDDLVRSCLEKAGGARLKSLGDGFMALFNSANQAIDAAISIQQAVEQRNLSNPELPISVRIAFAVRTSS